MSFVLQFTTPYQLQYFATKCSAANRVCEYLFCVCVCVCVFATLVVPYHYCYLVRL